LILCLPLDFMSPTFPHTGVTLNAYPSHLHNMTHPLNTVRGRVSHTCCERDHHNIIPEREGNHHRIPFNSYTRKEGPEGLALPSARKCTLSLKPYPTEKEVTRSIQFINRKRMLPSNLPLRNNGTFQFDLLGAPLK